MTRRYARTATAWVDAANCGRLVRQAFLTGMAQ